MSAWWLGPSQWCLASSTPKEACTPLDPPPAGGGQRDSVANGLGSGQLLGGKFLKV